MSSLFGIKKEGFKPQPSLLLKRYYALRPLQINDIRSKRKRRILALAGKPSLGNVPIIEAK